MDDQIELQREWLRQFEELASSIKNQPEPNLSKGYLDTQINILTNFWDKIDATHIKIFQAGTAEERAKRAYFFDKEYENAFKLYNKISTHTRNKIEKLNKPTPIPTTTFKMPENLVITQNKSNIKLTPIPMPRFSGDFKEWITFNNMFQSLVHNNEEFSALQKFHYLKSSLSGEAARLINKYSIREEDYEAAYKTVQDRYHNEVILVDTHLIAIVAQPNLLTESAEGLKEMLDVTKENIHALNSLKVETNTWDPMLLILLIPKLDPDTKRLWDTTLKPKIRPTFKEFLEFLVKRFHSLSCQQNVTLSIDSYGSSKVQVSKKANNSTFNTGNQGYNQSSNKFKHHNNHYEKNHQNFHTAGSSSKNACPLRPLGCNETHKLVQCERFRNTDVRKRMELVTCAKICKNCLVQHPGKCSLQPGCRKCGQWHHTFLHFDQINFLNSNLITTNATNQQQQLPQQQLQQSITTPAVTLSSNHAHVHSEIQSSNIKDKRESVIAWDEPVLLATAIILIRSVKDQRFYPFRCLLDQASEASYISEAIVQFLGLKKTPIVATTTGLGGTVTGAARSVADFEVGSKYNQNFIITIQAPVVSKITNLLPSTLIQNADWDHIRNLQLADPQFHKPGKIDILLGAPVYGYLLLPGLKKISPTIPIAQQTEFGWVLSGGARPPTTNLANFHLRIEIDDQLKKFFEQEEVSHERKLTQEEKECEEHFKETVRRNEEGRFVVALPFKREPSILGSSKGQAVSRLMKLESRLATNNELKLEYSKILDEYEELKHTTNFGKLDQQSESVSYFLPHHPVFKPESTTTKTRIVFDASAKTTSGISLNDVLMTGPTLQQDLPSILLRWRSHKIVFSADITKMYRQVVVRKEDRKYQSFLFRKNKNEPIQIYQHNMVTFGVTSATYLAVKSLQQLALEGKDKYPEASEIISKDFYMDDCMSGTDSIQSSIKLCKDLKELLASGKFELRKFISNSTEVLQAIPEEDRELKLPLEINIDNNVKTLGIRYYPSTDMFQFKVNLELSSEWPTKRSLLSETSKLFDPMGWLAPIIIRAKIFFRELWQEGLTWDAKLPNDMADKWMAFRNELHHIEKIKIKRRIGRRKDIKTFELHGFGDASEKAYSAVVYSRIVTKDSSIYVTMLAAKTRVAPLKPITLPRLELCGSVLVANLLNNVGKALNLDRSNMHGWTDSTIVLGWLKGDPSKFKTFVANRVVEAHEYMNIDHWHHIDGEINPADCASRGISPAEMKNHTLWWNGPECLREHRSSWIQNLEIPPATLELKSTIIKSHVVIQQEEDLENYITNYSDLFHLLRVTALQLRFINNVRSPKDKISSVSLTVKEIQQARERLLRLYQEKQFSREIHDLSAKRNVQPKSVITSLNPFLDQEGLLRVGGRLDEANLPYDRKHPIILSNGSLTDLIITEAHHRCLHGGTKLTINVIRETYWIINLRRLVKRHILRCVTCFRFKATVSEQIMGTLPRARVTTSSPFTHTGVDYAGPFNIKASNLKSPPCRIKPIVVDGKLVETMSKVPTFKGYIALFVCFATKAIHIEVVSDMTTETFIAALKRFTSRRSTPTDLYSDNGSTFIGAKNILSDELEKSLLDYKAVSKYLTEKEIQWHFIPPKNANQGGLWESGIKSMKHHLKRVIGDTTLTFEELTTVTCQIEACLNSRPLCPLTDEPDDLDVLTPGHFLTGRPMIAIPSGNADRHKGNMRDRWRLQQKLLQDIWETWSKDYLNQLQQRGKWKQQKSNLKKGDIVLLKEDDIPPTKWPLARILEVFPGRDNNVRVARIRARINTITGEYVRPINKLCLLPIVDNEQRAETDN